MGDIVDISEAAKPRRNRRTGDDGRSRIALVLAGGGFTGGVYQIGALRALDLLAVDATVNDFDIYVGTSAGSFVSALIANGARPDELMALLDGQEVEGYEPLDMKGLMRPNIAHLMRRGVRIPFSVAGLMRDVAMGLGRGMTLFDFITLLADVSPGGFYSLSGMEDMLKQQLRRPGFSDDFRRLAKELYIVAVDLDTVEPVTFGEQGWDDIPISRAVAASSTLPVVFEPTRIRNRDFVDGGLRSFANIETAVEKGAKLVIIINPIVPFYNDRLAPYTGTRTERISSMGVGSVGAQMFKSLVWSAFHERLRHWQQMHPGVDFILIEPQRNDGLMFSTQILNTSQRVRIARHGFESVTVQLAEDFEKYREICERHGLIISRRGVIEVMQAAQEDAPSGVSAWQRILERDAQ